MRKRGKQFNIIMDDLILWCFGIILFLGIVYSLIASIVNKIKEPTEAEERLINLKEEKEKYSKLSKEAEEKIIEAENQIHAAKIEVNRYISTRDNLVARYNNAISKFDSDVRRRALDMLSYSNDLLLNIAPQCDIPELHQSILEGRLLKAFESTPIISNVKISALVKSPNGTYTTTLENCTCQDFHFRNHPCKHMLYLYYIIGMLQVDKPLIDEAVQKTNDLISQIKEKNEDINKLDNLKIALENDIKNIQRKKQESMNNLVYFDLEIEKKKRMLNDRLNSFEKEIENKKLNAVKEFDDFKELLKNKEFRYSEIAKAFADVSTQLYSNAAYYLSNKKNPAFSAADTVKALRQETKGYVQELTELRLKFAYIEELFPNINDVFDTGFNEQEAFELETQETTDRVRLFLSPEEYNRLSTTEKNQLALDRYIENRKSKWQIGRDYEMYVGHSLENEGYKVQYTGIIENLEDMGRDLIATKENKTLIVQCKNWSQEKTIHEKHIFQLYGTLILYKLDNPMFEVKGVFITTTKLSEKARAVANELDIKIVEQLPLGDFPRIKCNINRTTGEKIYHLPFDQQYDTTVINKKDGELYAFTVKEAEEKGFRRAWKHFTN